MALLNTAGQTLLCAGAKNGKTQASQFPLDQCINGWCVKLALSLLPPFPVQPLSVQDGACLASFQNRVKNSQHTPTTYPVMCNSRNSASTKHQQELNDAHKSQVCPLISPSMHQVPYADSLTNLCSVNTVCRDCYRTQCSYQRRTKVQSQYSKFL